MTRKLPKALAFALAAAALLAPAGARGQADSPRAEAKPPGIEPRADELMKKMAALLARTKSFTLEAEESFDAEFAKAYRVQLTNVRTLTLERPSRFVATAVGDTAHRASWYDGKTLTVLNQKANAYAVLEMPGTIDAVLDTLASDYEVFLPLSDLLYGDPYPTLMADVLYGKYLGVHRAAGVACHHLSFGQEGVEWQIWIDAGPQPLPRKLAIAYWDQPGVPQYQATFRKWTLEPKPAPTAAQFDFKAPRGARKVTFEELRNAAVSSAVAAAKP
jgi:hypothetical protein